MLTDQPFMKFEIREKVKHFKEDRSFNELSSLELQPIIKVYESKNQVEVNGHLVLHGEFLTKEEDWEQFFNESDGIHYHPFYNKKEEEADSFQYQIPLSIQMPRDRVEDTAELFVVVEDFDYEILSSGEMELTAQIKLLGVHPDPKQDTPAEFHSNMENEEFSFSESHTQDGGVSSTEPQEEDRKNQQDKQRESQAEPKVEPMQDQEEHPKSHQEETAQPTISVEEEKNTEQRDDAAQQMTENQSIKQELEEQNEGSLENETSENEGYEIEKSEDENTEKESEEETEASETVEKAEEQTEETTAKVKIGITRKDKEAKTDGGENTVNPLYSLFKKGQKNESETVEQELSAEETVQDQKNETDEASLKKEEQILEVEKEKELEKQEAEEMQPENESDLAEANEEVQAEDPKAEDTKEMLYSLLKGNEDNKYKLKIYLVHKEDTLEKIAEKYNLEPQELIRYNQLDSQELEEGQLLYLPKEG